MISRCLIIACLVLSALCQAAEPLPVDQAFRISARVVDAGRVEIRADVAPGYYLYRDRIDVQSQTEQVQFGVAQIPAGITKADPLFGQVQTLRDQVLISVPYQRLAQDVTTLNLQVAYQGCADMGVCYPPQTRTFQLPLTGPDATSSSLGKLFDTFSSGLSQLGLAPAQDELLPAEQAFHFFAEAVDGQTVSLNWQIADGYYLYRDKLSVQLLAPDAARLGALALPQGKSKSDPTFGDSEVYYESLQARQGIVWKGGERKPVRLKVGFQGCAEIGVCYPPMSQTVSVTLPAGGVTRSAPTPPVTTQVSTQDRLASAIQNESMWLTTFSFLGFGLLLAFTPCVFPMIPILSGIIVGHGHHITTRKAFALSLSYVIASALTYTAFGILAGLFGRNLQAAFQNPWLIGTFSALFVVLALSMFGFFQLQLPGALQSKLARANQSQRAGTLLGAATMGVLSTLIVGPCVAPPLAGALIYIGQTGDALLGGLALFALGMGMGMPLILIGTSAGKLLPKAGTWMEAVKAVFGVMLLAVAIWLLDRIVPVEVSMLLWAALLIVCAVFLKVLEPLPQTAGSGQRLLKGFGFVLIAYGLVLIVGAAIGGGNVLQPLRGLSGVTANSGSEHGLPFRPIHNTSELNQALVEAEAAQQMVMLDFYADWCVSCKEMELFTFTDPKVQSALSNSMLLQVDVTDNNAEHQALLKRFGLIGPPAILFFGPGQQEQQPYRVIGYMPATHFNSHVRRAASCVETRVC